MWQSQYVLAQSSPFSADNPFPPSYRCLYAPFSRRSRILGCFLFTTLEPAWWHQNRAFRLGASFEDFRGGVRSLGNAHRSKLSTNRNPPWPPRHFFRNRFMGNCLPQTSGGVRRELAERLRFVVSSPTMPKEIYTRTVVITTRNQQKTGSSFWASARSCGHEGHHWRSRNPAKHRRLVFDGSIFWLQTRVLRASRETPV